MTQLISANYHKSKTFIPGARRVDFKDIQTHWNPATVCFGKYLRHEERSYAFTLMLRGDADEPHK